MTTTSHPTATESATQGRRAAGGPGSRGPALARTGAPACPPSGGTSNVESSRERRLASVPPKYRRLFRRAWGRQSRKAALRGFCLMCVDYNRAEVERCTAPACPLWEYRLRG